MSTSLRKSSLYLRASSVALIKLRKYESSCCNAPQRAATEAALMNPTSGSGPPLARSSPEKRKHIGAGLSRVASSHSGDGWYPSRLQ